MCNDVNVCNGNGHIGDEEDNNDKEDGCIKVPLELFTPTAST